MRLCCRFESSTLQSAQCEPLLVIDPPMQSSLLSTSSRRRNHSRLLGNFCGTCPAITNAFGVSPRQILGLPEHGSPSPNLQIRIRRTPFRAQATKLPKTMYGGTNRSDVTSSFFLVLLCYPGVRLSNFSASRSCRHGACRHSHTIQ